MSITRSYNVNIEDLSLDQIMFDLEEPTRTAAIERYLSPDTSVVDEGSLLKAFDGSGKPIVWEVSLDNGQKIKFQPAGRRLSRQLCITILDEFGKGGKYHGMHRETGLRKRADMSQWSALQKEDWGDKAKDPKFINKNYISHIPDKATPPETEPTE